MQIAQAAARPIDLVIHWLETVNLSAPSAKILLVATHADDVHGRAVYTSTNGTN